MTRWTGFVIAHRKRIVAAWVVLFLLGGPAAANLGGLLSNRFSEPGSESERGLELLQERMGDRSDGSFTLVASGVGSPDEAAAATSSTCRSRPRSRTRTRGARRRSCGARSATSRA